MARRWPRRSSGGRGPPRTEASREMKRSERRILTTHVGSLTRPQLLRDLAAAAEKDPGSLEKYHAQLRQDVAEVVKQQAGVGIDVVSDGEYGKHSWAAYI